LHNSAEESGQIPVDHLRSRMTHRLFIALRPPPHIRDRLIDCMDAVTGARWQDDDQLHLTLRYVGEVDRHRANDLAEALGALRMPSCEIELTGTGVFERKGRPHLLWAGVAPNETLVRLQKKIERICQSMGIEALHRKFIPHVTLARLNSSSGPVGAFLATTASARFGSWKATSFGLFESHLREQGSLYVEIVEYPLATAA